MRRSVGTSLVILTALILQTTVLPHLALFRVAPDLLLVVVISVALARGPSAGALAGFAGGVLRDLLLDGPTGLSALAYLSVGYVVGAVLPYVQSSSVAVPLVGVFAGSLAGTAFYNVLALLLGVRAQPLNRMAQVVVLTAVYNTLLVPFAYPVVRWVTANPRGEPLYQGRAG
ncbi:MAG TPA: rod shape-determining protein MreD [Actinomycetota bacterium]|nr:rod shape-determining protein MreD [Actinomycetota bacterium]